MGGGVLSVNDWPEANLLGDLSLDAYSGEEKIILCCQELSQCEKPREVSYLGQAGAHPGHMEVMQWTTNLLSACGLSHSPLCCFVTFANM